MERTRHKISALIITYNEIGYIEKCIESVSFADEILVIDSFSTDGTYEYLLNHPKVQVLQNPFENFTAQKSYALKNAKNDWVLFLDADEIVSSRLKEEIIDTISVGTDIAAFWFYRQFMFQNKRLRFSGWQTDKNYRLFKKSKIRFVPDKIVHETLEVNGKSGIFKEKLVHYCYKNFSEYRAKMLKYGNMRAHEEFLKQKKFNYCKLILKPGWKFIYNFVFRLGFLDFKRGLSICYLDALSVYQRYKNLRILEISGKEKRYRKLTLSPVSEERLAS